MCNCIERFSSIKVKRVFEVGCGGAPHAEELIRRGYIYTGLDKNRNMLDYATTRWHHLTPVPEFMEADMVSFIPTKKHDFAFVMLGSLYLNSIEEMTSHFDCMADCLRSGSLYFLDWCVQFTDPLTRSISNSIVNERDGIKVESNFKTRLIDSVRQMYEETWTLNVDDHGQRQRFQMVERNKAVFPQEFLLFIENLTDFEMIGWWKDWDLSKPIDGETEVDRPVILIKRK